MSAMARGRASGPVDTTTLEGRLRAARLDSSYSAQELAEALGLASEVSIYEYENPKKNKRPSVAQLGILAKKTGKPLDWLVYGEGAEDSPFLSKMRALQDELDYRAQQNILRLAESEAEQYRAREARRAQEDGAFETIKRQMLAAGIDPATIEQVVQRARATAEGSTSEDVARPA